MAPPSAPAALEETREPRPLHGPIARAVLLVAGVVLAIGVVASYLAAVVTVARVGPVVLQRASWHSLDGGAWFIVMMSLALPLHLAAHELGHALAGRWVGYEFLSIQVGPFCLDRPSGRWRVTWQPLQFGLGGRASAARGGSRRLARRTAIFAAGGPAANLLLALVAGLAAAAVPLPETAPGAVAVGFLNGCAAQGVILCVLNLVPIRGAGADGARILEALRRPGERVAEEGDRGMPAPGGRPRVDPE